MTIAQIQGLTDDELKKIAANATEDNVTDEELNALIHETLSRLARRGKIVHCEVKQ